MGYEAFYAENVERFKSNGRQAYGRCNFHDDKVASLSINLVTSQFMCHACGIHGNALTFARRLGIRPPSQDENLDSSERIASSPKARQPAPLAAVENDQRATTPPPQISKTYEYLDETGAPLFRVLRYEPKSFRQQKWTGSDWAWGADGVRRVPYRLPQVIKTTGTVYLVEGEKDVETLERIGLVATTTPMGANSWQAEYAQYFKGKYVAILPDNDDPGRAYALQAARDISAAGGHVKIVNLPGQGPKEDVTDYLGKLENSKDTLLRFVMSVAPFGEIRHSSEDPVTYLNRFGIYVSDGAGYFPTEFKEICRENYRQFMAAAKNCTDLVMAKLEEVDRLWQACRTKAQYQRFCRALKEAHELSLADVA